MLLVPVLTTILPLSHRLPYPSFKFAPLQVVRVMYALSILLLVTAVYAVLASQLYGDRSPENFGRFSYALFSVRTFDKRT